MKYILAMIALIIGLPSSPAQSPVVQESVPFQRPLSGWVKVVQMKNGTTAVVCVDRSNITVRLYDEQRNLKVEKIITPKYDGRGELRYGDVNAVFEVRNDLVLFLGDLIKKTPILYRVIIDGTTGLLKTESEEARIEGFKYNEGFSMHIIGTPAARFIVRRDPNSFHYGVAAVNRFEADPGKRIRLIHYGEDHQIINQAYIAPSGQEFDHFDLYSLDVIKDQKLVICGQVINDDSKHPDYLALYSLEKNSSSIQVKPLESLTKTFKNAILRYNDTDNSLAILGLVETGKKRSITYYSGAFVLLDALSLTIKTDRLIDMTNVNRLSKDALGPQEHYDRGVPQNLHINNDGTYTVVFEEWGYLSDMLMHKDDPGMYATLGNIAVVMLDNKGEEIHSYFMPKKHYVRDIPTDQFYLPLYLMDQLETAQRVTEKGNNECRSFIYVNGIRGNMVFFNDWHKNQERTKDGKLANAGPDDKLDAYICRLENEGIKKDLVFSSSDKGTHTYAFFPTFDYDPKTGNLVTLQTDEKNEKWTKVVWIGL